MKNSRKCTTPLLLHIPIFTIPKEMNKG